MPEFQTKRNALLGNSGNGNKIPAQKKGRSPSVRYEELASGSDGNEGYLVAIIGRHFEGAFHVQLNDWLQSGTNNFGNWSQPNRRAIGSCSVLQVNTKIVPVSKPHIPEIEGERRNVTASTCVADPKFIHLGNSHFPKI